MEECLDRGQPIVVNSSEPTEDDCRIHAQWSNKAGGNPVASLPLIAMDETVAIVSMSQGGGTRLTREQVVLMQEELSGYSALVPLSLTANRSLAAHASDSLRKSMKRLQRRGPVRLCAMLASLLLLASWLAFGTLNHTFTVPCTVKATDRRTIACPRAGSARRAVRAAGGPRAGRATSGRDRRQ